MNNRRHICLFALAAAGGILFFEGSGGIKALIAFLFAAAAFGALGYGHSGQRTIAAAGVFKNREGPAEDPPPAYDGLQAADPGDRPKHEPSLKSSAMVFAAAAAVFLLFFLRCAYTSYTYQDILDDLPDGEIIELTGRVSQKTQKSEAYQYIIKNAYYEYEGGTFYAGSVTVYFESDDIPIGSAALMCGSCYAFSHEENEGGFDRADYYRYKNITFCVYADEMSAQKTPALSVRERLYELQRALTEVFDSELNERDSGILCALVLGNKALLDEDIRDIYREGGISHILAISGLHISFIGLSIFRLLRRLRCSYPLSAGAGFAAAAVFAIMSGLSVSAVRALIMFAVLMGAELFGRTYDSADSLCLAALIMLILNPFSLFQSSFQLSFAAMTAIALSPLGGQRKKKRHKKKRFVKKLLSGLEDAILKRLVMSFHIQLFLMPLTAWMFYEVSLYGLFLNILVVSLCGYLLGLGLIGGFAGLFAPGVSKWILVPAHFILDIYDKALEMVLSLPGSTVITGRPAVWFIAAYYLALIAAHILRGDIFKGRYTGGIEEENASTKTKGLSLAVCIHDLVIPSAKGRIAKAVSGLFCAVFLILIIASPQKGEARVDFLSIGQGDGAFICDGNGRNIFIDGGSSSEDEAGRYVIEPFLKYNSIRSIDAWIVTHPDEDHISGLMEMLDGRYRIDCIIISEASKDDEDYEELFALAKSAGTDILFCDAGDELSLSGIEFECLYPLAGSDESDDANELSQVWEYKSDGLTILFTGDIGADQEELLIERGLLEDVTVLKAAHHGSKNSSSAAFLDIVKPEFTIISCGEDNLYGHPHEETLERLSEAGSKVYITWQTGQISLRKKDGVWVMSFPCG